MHSGLAEIDVVLVWVKMPVPEFVASYAVTDKSSCHFCHKSIAKGELRLTRQDGEDKGRHYHVTHGLGIQWRLRPVPVVRTTGLKPEDAAAIKAKLADIKLRKKKRDFVATSSHFVASYAPGSQATCKACGKKIDKGALRLSREVGSGCFTGHGASMPCHGIQLHYHAAHGADVAAKVKCGSSKPKLVTFGDLKADDEKRLKQTFAKAVAKRVVACKPVTKK